MATRIVRWNEWPIDNLIEEMTVEDLMVISRVQQRRISRAELTFTALNALEISIPSAESLELGEDMMVS